MLRAQEIYGPHDGRTWSDGPLAMGRRLFRTLPEDAHDRQPLQSRDGRLVLVADIRLDCRDELIGALGLPADEAGQTCDAAILLASLERWGESALDRIAGDFAFALWDARAQKLLLARDFRGMRPLHYHCGRGFFAFASMPKGLHALPEIPYAPDEQTMAEFLTLMPQRGPRSFFKDIGRVEQAQVVTITRNGISMRHYWNPQRPSSMRLSSDDYVEGLRHHLDEAVSVRLRGANGAVASHLSAGYDSAAVTATAARLMAPSRGKVVAFTSVPREGYDGPAPRNRFNDEGPLAAATAAMYPNVEHVLIRRGHASPLEGFGRDFFLFDRPMVAAANSVWLYAVNQAARERKLGILLSGQMGNLTLSYGGLELLPELLRTGHFIRLWRTAARLVAKTDVRWRGAMAKTFGPFLPAQFWQRLNEAFTGASWDIREYSAIRPRLAAKLAARARERDLDFAYRPWKDSFAMRLWVLGRADLGNYNKGSLAGWGVDQRDPTADKRLVEFCLSVPTDQFLNDGVPRALAKRALADRLPRAVLDASKKGYQTADWHEGLTAARGEVAAELDRLATCGPAAELLDIERMKRLVADWPTSGWERPAVMRAYRLALLRGISAGHFLRKASGANR
jgi:asparagine synthase (glutamine-hydrolysing)